MVFNQDSWRIPIITLVAIAIKDNLEVVKNPNCMMNIANGLAAAGVPHIVKMLNEGHQSPIWNLSEAFAELFQSDIKTEEQSDHDRLAEVLL